MSSSSKPRLHVDTTTTTTTGSAGSASSSRPSAASGSGSAGQNQACAACKYQRRKCNPDCPLAPYFPADQQRRFLNAHRLFGVKNIQKTLGRIDPERGPDAMRALIYQADARAADPVGGCVTIIEQLQRQIERTEFELAYVRHQIAIYRQAAADPLADNNPAMILPATAAVPAGHQDMDSLYAAGQEPVTGGGAGVVFQDHQGYHQVRDQKNHHQQQQLYNYFAYDGTTAGDEATSSSSHGHDGRVHQEQYNFANTNNVRIGSPVALGEQLEQHCQIDQAAPFVDAFDVKPQHGMLEHHGPAGVVHHREEKLGAVLKHDVDQQMEEETATGAAAPCHLELGFSSF